MKKNILFLTVLIVCLCSTMLLSGPPQNDSNIDKQLRKIAQGINPENWRQALSVFTQDETRGAIADSIKAGALNYYFLNASDSDPLYGGMSLTATSTISSTTFPAISDAVNWTLCSQFISPQGQPGLNTLSFGTYPIRGVVTKGAGASLELCVELWKITTASATTFIATSSHLVVVSDNTIYPSVYDFVITSEVSLNLTDRFLFRRYAKKVSGTGTSATITSWFGNGYSSYFNFPVPGGNIALSNASNITATDSWRAALEVYSKNQISSSGQALIQGAGQVASLGANIFTGKQSLAVASGGFTVYQGNAFTFSSGSSSVILPVDGTTTNIPLPGSNLLYAKAVVVAYVNGSTTRIIFDLSSKMEVNGGTLTTMGASFTERVCNVDADKELFWAKLVETGNVLSVIASGPINTVWQVKKLEVGGL